MSNKIVSGTYRAVIDDVIANVRQDFEEMGIEKEVLEELQRSWEARLVATGVTDFEGAAAPPRAPRRPAAATNGSAAADDKKGAEDVKPKLADNAGEGSSSGAQAGDVAAAGAASSSSATAAGGSGSGSGSSKARRTEGGHDATHARSNGHDGGVDGAAAGGEEGPAGSQKAGEKRKQPESNSDEIGSDLDDSDDEDHAAGEGGGEALDGDTVLCLYDKVNRVRNRWKCILRDGVANIDGRDYLFSRCNTEFEW